MIGQRVDKIIISAVVINEFYKFLRSNLLFLFSLNTVSMRKKETFESHMYLNTEVTCLNACYIIKTAEISHIK